MLFHRPLCSKVYMSRDICVSARRNLCCTVFHNQGVYRDSTMSRTTNKLHEASKRRRSRPFHKAPITNQHRQRTLRPPVHRRLARERAPQLWKRPWVSDPAWRSGRTYPPASLLGLPAELRQQILYLSWDMQETKKVSDDVQEARNAPRTGRQQSKRAVRKVLGRRVGEL